MKWKRKGMVFKMHSFISYFQYYIKSNRNYFILLLLIQSLTIPILSFTSSDTSYNIYITLIESCFFNGFLFAIILPIFNFHYLYTKTSHDIFFSLPIKRKHLFLFQFISGLIVLLVPLTLEYIISYLFLYLQLGSLASIPYTPIAYLFLFIIFLFGEYTITTLFCVKCNHLLDAIIIVLSSIILPLVIILSSYIFTSQQIANIVGIIGIFEYEIIDFSFIGSFISFPYFFWKVINEIIYAIKMFEIGEIFEFSYSNWFFFYWFILSIVSFYFAYKHFIQRKPEDAQQRTTTMIGYPCIITIITFCFLLIAQSLDNYILFSILIFIIYLCMIFISNRKLYIHWKHLFTYVIIFLIAISFSFTFKKTNGFGRIQEFPDINNVETITISIDMHSSNNYSYLYMNLLTNENIDGYTTEINSTNAFPSALEFQSITSKYHIDYIYNTTYNDYYAIDIYYKMNYDNLYISRFYTIPYTKESKQILTDYLNSLQDEYNVTIETVSYEETY